LLVASGSVELPQFLFWLLISEEHWRDAADYYSASLLAASDAVTLSGALSVQRIAAGPLCHS